MNRYWISWYDEHLGAWELHSPWWVSGEGPNGELIVCAAVMAPSEAAAVVSIVEAHDNPMDALHLRWRFREERPDDWSPFSARFPRADWMQWPKETANA